MVIVLFTGHKLYSRTFSFGVNLATVDVDHGRRELNLKDEMDAERAEYALLPWYKKIWRALT